MDWYISTRQYSLDDSSTRNGSRVPFFLTNAFIWEIYVYDGIRFFLAQLRALVEKLYFLLSFHNDLFTLNELQMCSSPQISIKDTLNSPFWNPIAYFHTFVQNCMQKWKIIHRLQTCSQFGKISISSYFPKPLYYNKFPDQNT